MPNRIGLVIHYLACFKAGLVATPLNYRYTHREIDHALEVSGARALLAHVERDEDVAASGLAASLALGAIAYGGFEAGGERASSAARRRAPGRAGAEPEPRRARRRSSSPRAAPGRRRASPTPTRRCAG